MKIVTRAMIIAWGLCMLGVFSGCPVGPGNDDETANKPPIAEFTYTLPTCVQYDITFSASASRDPDGQIASFDWDFGDNSSASGATVTKRYKTVGAYTVSLTVTDDRGLQAVARTSIKVKLEPDPDCSTERGCYAFIGPRWQAVSGCKWVIMVMTQSLRGLDPGWSSVDRNSAVSAMGEWHWDSCAKIGFRYATTAPSILAGRNGLNTISVESIDGTGGSAAQAHIWTINGYIGEVDVVVDRAESWGVRGEGARLDLVSVLTHELGHLWCLNDLPNSSCYWETMHAYISPGTMYKRTLYCGDKHGVQQLYGYECRKPGTIAADGDGGVSEPAQPVIVVTSSSRSADPER